MPEAEKDSSNATDIMPTQDDDLKFPEPGSRERALAEKRLVRKLDIRLLPTIILIYVMNYIDVCAIIRMQTLYSSMCIHREMALQLRG